MKIFKYLKIAWDRMKQFIKKIHECLNKQPRSQWLWGIFSILCIGLTSILLSFFIFNPFVVQLWPRYANYTEFSVGFFILFLEIIAYIARYYIGKIWGEALMESWYYIILSFATIPLAFLIAKIYWGNFNNFKNNYLELNGSQQN